ncbi:hypothetical protein EC973_006922 [Apophysomyces ossiformis]|uniref:Zf-CHY-domain-containing protein n=1 Tax=Apophysomyces ossiformis TaxID=679940 RepID=A0A8H7ERC1_9FUNG|nr:hypothetical protein EC973_006922 [Apophysomyces ossiformis]
MPNRQDSESDLEYDHDLNVMDEDDDDWWDAEDQTQSNATPVANETSGNHSQPRNGLNETELRKKMLEIQQDNSIHPKEKARMMQYLIRHGTIPPASSPSGETSSDDSDTTATDNGYSISYQNESKKILGCKHYQRKCKLQANCCGKIFTCRFCHDETTNHSIVRTDTKNMLCMLCLTLQPAAQTCRQCKIEVARYYCGKCKLWDNDPKKSIYHCDDCGICRQGQGLGQDYFHCKTCNVCMELKLKDNHRCIERNLESDCPICGEYMFTSLSKVIFMPCGHCIHKMCYTTYIQTSYQCPMCLKSLGNMFTYFARLDRELERQSMPPEYEKYISHIFCNDCERKSPAKYHFFYHKCGHCRSYNTTVLKTENTEETAAAQTNGEDPKPTSSSMAEGTTETLSANSDQEQILQASGTPRNGSAGTYISSLGVRLASLPNNDYDSPSSSSSPTARNHMESNDG